MQELRRFTINLKSLNQDIEDSIVVGAGDANGRTLAVILTQEAAARFTPSTRLYLSWQHNDTKIQGLNVFTKVSDKPQTWEIKYPQEMLDEGTVLACLKIIDEISIDCSTNFLITVLSDPNSIQDLDENNNYTIFKQAALELNNTNENFKNKIEDWQSKYNELIDWLKELPQEVQDILNERVGELPEDVTNYIEYIDKLQKEQDESTERDIKTMGVLLKKYTDSLLTITEY